METVSGAHCSAQPNYRRHWGNQWLQRISQISEYLVMVSYLPLSQSIQRPNGLETIGLLHFWRLRELDQDTEWILWMGDRWIETLSGFHGWVIDGALLCMREEMNHFIKALIPRVEGNLVLAMGGLPSLLLSGGPHPACGKKGLNPSFT